jgi:hypothetical protein
MDLTSYLDTTGAWLAIVTAGELMTRSHPVISVHNAESALQAHQVQASPGVPISTIPAQAGPSAEVV